MKTSLGAVNYVIRRLILCFNDRSIVTFFIERTREIMAFCSTNIFQIFGANQLICYSQGNEVSPHFSKIIPAFHCTNW